jgi:hypothetical protein
LFGTAGVGGVLKPKRNETQLPPIIERIKRSGRLEANCIWNIIEAPFVLLLVVALIS